MNDTDGALKLWRDVAQRWGRRWEFSGDCLADHERWRAAALPAVLETLGRRPESRPIAPELVEERVASEQVRVQTWRLQVFEGHALCVSVCIPATERERSPAVLCLPGHGRGGARAVAGLGSGDGVAEEVARYRSDFGWRLAAAGFVTYTTDWLGVGETTGGELPQGRDWCNMHYLAATALGSTPLGFDVARIRAVTDFLLQLDFVDPQWLGIAGFSGGAAHALWAALDDRRYMAVELSGYAGSFTGFALGDLRYCGAQITPGLFSLVDLGELVGLLAPRSLLFDIGRRDEVFPLRGASDCYSTVRRIYEVAQAPERLEVNYFDGGHRWDDSASVAFFSRAFGLGVSGRAPQRM